ncbi:MAG: flavoprotein, partial [Thermoguttaceae bacterium]
GAEPADRRSRRETPLSQLMLENMSRAAAAGASILPAMPGFYHGVKTIGDLVDFVVARICDQLGIRNSLIQRWGEEEGGDAIQSEHEKDSAIINTK